MLIQNISRVSNHRCLSTETDFLRLHVNPEILMQFPRAAESLSRAAHPSKAAEPQPGTVATPARGSSCTKGHWNRGQTDMGQADGPRDTEAAAQRPHAPLASAFPVLRSPLEAARGLGHTGALKGLHRDFPKLWMWLPSQESKRMRKAGVGDDTTR